MSKRARTKLVPQSMKPPKRQNLEAIEIGPSLSEQKENPSLSELDMEEVDMEGKLSARDVMTLWSLIRNLMR